MQNNHFNHRCRVCKQLILTKRNDAQYCSPKCKQQAYRNRKINWDFFNAALIIATGKFTDDKNTLLRGLEIKEIVFSEQNFKGKALIFEKTVDKLFYYLHLSQLVRNIFQYHDGKNITKKEFEKLQSTFEFISYQTDEKYSLILPEVFVFVDHLGSFLVKYKLIFDVNDNLEQKIDPNEPIFAEIINVYAKIDNILKNQLP